MATKKTPPIEYGWGPADKDGTRYVEKLRAAGLRFVGWSDEILDLRHKGWYTREDACHSDDTYRGCVLQLPARKGEPQYVGAYFEPGTEGYVVDVSDVTDDKDQAARAGDHLAERNAERERDYDSAWQHGQQWSNLQDEIRDTRAERVKLLRDLATAKRDAKAQGFQVPASLCAVVGREIVALRERIAKAREEAEELIYGFRRDLAEAFNDGAGEKVI